MREGIGVEPKVLKAEELSELLGSMSTMVSSQETSAASVQYEIQEDGSFLVLAMVAVHEKGQTSKDGGLVVIAKESDAAPE